jgi:enoyl-CoA hydratase/carnithine racemase
LPRIVGISQALEWAYCADILTPEEALQGRLIKAIVPHDQLLDEAHKLAHRMTDKRSPVATALARQMMYRNSAQVHPLAAHQVDSLAMFYTSRQDGKEGVRAFLEKRPADFSGKTSTDMPDFYPWW